jgi:hypothetical protein
MVIDTTVVGYTVSSCEAISQGRWAMAGGQSANLNNKFTATFGTLKGFTTTYTIKPTLPAMGAQETLISARFFDSLDYTAASGTVTLTNDTSGKNLTFKDVKFTSSGHPDVLVSGYLSCQ